MSLGSQYPLPCLAKRLAAICATVMSVIALMSIRIITFSNDSLGCHTAGVIYGSHPCGSGIAVHKPTEFTLSCGGAEWRQNTLMYAAVRGLAGHIGSGLMEICFPHGIVGNFNFGETSLKEAKIHTRQRSDKYEFAKATYYNISPIST